MSPIRFNNPSFSVLTIDKSRLIINNQLVFFRDMSRHKEEWTKLVDFKEEYGLENMGRMQMMDLWIRMSGMHPNSEDHSSQLMKTYSSLRMANSTFSPDCHQECELEFFCAMGSEDDMNLYRSCVEAFQSPSPSSSFRDGALSSSSFSSLLLILLSGGILMVGFLGLLKLSEKWRRGGYEPVSSSIQLSPPN